MLRKTFLAGIAALTMGGALATTPTSAQAQFYFGTGFGTGYYGGYPYGGYYGGYRPAYYGGYYGGYRRAYYGGYPYYRYRRNNGGAIAAGVIGGLALGALAATAAQPYYASPYYARPVYAQCWLERRRAVNRWGNVVVRRVRVCS